MRSKIGVFLLVASVSAAPTFGQRSTVSRGTMVKPIPVQPVRSELYRPPMHEPFKRIEPLKVPTTFNIDRFKLSEKPEFSFLSRPSLPTTTVPAPSYLFSGSNSGTSGGGGNYSGGNSGGSSSYDPDWFKKLQEKMLVETRFTVPTRPLINPNYADSYQCSCCGTVVNRGAGHVCAKESACIKQQIEKVKSGQ